MQLTRRELLGAIGAGGVGIGGVTLYRSHPDFTNYAYADSGDVDDHRLRVAWYERYNGRFREHQNGTSGPGLPDALDPDSEPGYVTEASTVTDDAGPVVTVGNVLPGDEGTLVVGLEVADGPDVLGEPLDVWLRAAITDDAENGINGPESVAGDTTDADGELDDDLAVELWRDGSPLGSCDGHKDVDEAIGGSLVPRAPMSVAFGPSSAVGGEEGVHVVSALQPGHSRCVALAWELPPETTNRSQGDSVAFSLAFAGGPAGAGSPFAVPAEDA